MLQTKVYSLLSMNDNLLLCGQRFGCLNLVCASERTILHDLKLPDKGAHIADMIRSGEDSLYAIASSKGLQIIQVEASTGMKHIESHLPQKDIKCLSLLKTNLILIGCFNSNELLLFNLSTKSIIQSFANPSGDKYP
jgi:hypothetical protein